MPDELDFIQEREAIQTAAAIQAARWQPAGESLEHCAECERPIPQARRNALPGVRLCIKCQTLFEHFGM